MDATRRDMERVNSDMSSLLTEFRSKAADAKEFATEMLLVQRRQEWLAATLEADDTALSSKISGQKDGHDGDSVTESRDVSALSRAGPCAGYEGLVTVGSLRSRAAEFRQCACQDAINSLRGCSRGKSSCQLS